MDPIGNSFVLLECVESTNNYAMAKVHAGLAKHGDVYYTHTQTAGKGQRGKQWTANPGENITLSCIIQPSRFSLKEQFKLSAIIALGCYDFVNHYMPGTTTIKWPNDIYINDRKAGGILIENSVKGRDWQYVVAGIGININQTSFDPDLRRATSLKQETGTHFDVVSLAKELCARIEWRWSMFPGSEIITEYNDRLYKRHQTAQLKSGEAVINAEIQGVNDHGQLMVRTYREMIFNWGEVEWIIGES